MSYNHLEIEAKWQKYWLENESFKTNDYSSKPKYYALDMFPYPSGSGLHVGHPEGYTATDILSRAKRMQGFEVLHPMGWDAFGLPAEQYALQTGNDPETFTKENIQTFTKQIQMLGLSYDWTRELATCDANYYRNTQWIFSKLYEKGLAELKEVEVNWCEAMGTVLANDEMVTINGVMVSDRGHHPVVKKPMKQWILKITAYAERLLADLDELDWPESLIEMQRNWIGKSVGAKVSFKVASSDLSFEVFTTRPDTLFGVTYCTLAPEHALVDEITLPENKEAVQAYIMQAKAKSDIERTELAKDKTGVFTGSYAINPVNNELVPIWISDYVLASYGTGAVMAVPAHDQRDFEFAQKFNLAIKPVLEGYNGKQAFVDDASHINSDFINGLNKQEASEKVIEYLEENELGKKHINYRIRDWLFSRQRYWGEPFPVAHLEDGTIKIIEDLPVVLPKIDNIKPSGDGRSPLANAHDWLNVEIDGQKAQMETNTMPQSAGSSWYYLGYILANNGTILDLESPEAIERINEWLPVDIYIGGAEHAVGHLMYARFWHKFLYDLGIVKTKEPFKRLFNQGMILGENNEKMSKSKGNVINPDDIVASHGADTLRVYEMFMGPLEQAKPWNNNGVDGARRFLDRVYRLYTTPNKISKTNDGKLDKVYHQTVKKVTSDFDQLHFNTAISQLMVFINECYKQETIYEEYALGFLQMFGCIAPHLGEELYTMIKPCGSFTYETWPTYDEKYLVEDSVLVVCQVNGKIRAKIEMAKDLDEESIKTLAFEHENVKAHLEGVTIRKVIVIKNKLVNIVAN